MGKLWTLFQRTLADQRTLIPVLEHKTTIKRNVWLQAGVDGSACGFPRNGSSIKVECKLKCVANWRHGAECCGVGVARDYLLVIEAGGRYKANH